MHETITARQELWPVSQLHAFQPAVFWFVGRTIGADAVYSRHLCGSENVWFIKA